MKTVIENKINLKIALKLLSVIIVFSCSDSSKYSKDNYHSEDLKELKMLG